MDAVLGADEAVTDTLDPEKLTAPELRTARLEARRLLKQVEACGGCFCCSRRDRASEGWERANCGLNPPAIFKGARCTFDPDLARLAPFPHATKG
jgi:hypothetical protein